jgi:hypothetical protein
MIQNRKIVIFLAGLVFTAFFILFIHSELELFCNHNDICEDVDLCLIVDSATNAYDNDINNLQLLFINHYFHSQSLINDVPLNFFRTIPNLLRFSDNMINCTLSFQFIILLI